jgi:tripartite-type tricarboxylate transporter receptor subunit TctC
MHRLIAPVGLFAGALTLACAAAAQTYPTKPIRVVVPFPAGGTSDILARVIGPKLTEAWGPQIIVDNRPGANGNIGGEMVARAVPDGYTLILMDVGNLAISPSVFAKMPFDILKDFAPVTMVSYSPHLLSVHPSIPVRTVKELIAFARARPGKLNVPVGLGGAPQFAAMSFASRTGIDWVYLPTKGGGSASVMAVAVGEGDVLFLGMLQSLPHVKNGKLKLIAVSSAQRDPALPDTPTIAETPGLEGFVTGSWQGILAPANTPPDIVNKINAEVIRVLKIPDIRDKLSNQGAVPQTSTPPEMGQWLAAEKDRWAKLVKQTGFKLQPD